MGEVYRARDSRLGRDLAIKVLPTELASNPERLKRFEREARAASALSHPNIVTVYDVGTTGAVSYMAIELIDGKTLHDLVVPGPLPMRKLLDVAVQIADGLAAAHEAGIVHRDLKPQNVMVSRTGFVKILDFGIAKVRAALASAPANSGYPTVEQAVETLRTTPGVLLGTTDYMSPEQARGKPIDFRSDQFSFGAVLYEMTTGRRAFGRATLADILTAILQQEPTPVAQLRPDAPAPLRWIIERCLAKSPSDRYASTRDLARELQALKEHVGEVSVVAESAKRSPWISRVSVPVAALVLAAAAGAALFLPMTQHRSESSTAVFRRLTFRHGYVSRAIFVANSDEIIYTASWDGEPERTFIALPQSSRQDRIVESERQVPIGYSEDGSRLLVLLGVTYPWFSEMGTLAWRPSLGGPSRKILDNVICADWAMRRHLLAVVRDMGGERHLEIRDGEGALLRTLFQTTGTISDPHFSHDERDIAFIHHYARLDSAGEVRLASSDRNTTTVLTPAFPSCLGLYWHPKTDEIWFTASREGFTSSALWAVNRRGKIHILYSLTDPFVLQSVSADGQRCLLTSRGDRVRMIVRQAGDSPRDLSWFDGTFATDLSADGKAVLFYDFYSSLAMSGSWTRPIEGGDAVRVGEGEFARFSPDNRWIVALTQASHGPPQLVLQPTGEGKSRQLTFGQANHWAPGFAGDHTVVYVRTDAGRSEIWKVETDGSDEQRLGATGCDLPMADPEAKSFLCVGDKSNRVLFVYSMKGGVGRRLYELPEGERFRYARWSRNGQILAVTNRRRFLALDVATGRVIRQEELPVPPSERYDELYTAAIAADESSQAYSLARFSSNLYLATGIK